LREMADDDREFLDFFADQFWSLRQVGFLLTGDWDQAEELAQEDIGRPGRGGEGDRRSAGFQRLGSRQAPVDACVERLPVGCASLRALELPRFRGHGG
jgi:hypothetical protein